MNPSQQAAFEAAAGSGMSPAVLNLLCIGALLAVLFLWAARDWLMFTGAGQMKMFVLQGWGSLLSGQ